MSEKPLLWLDGFDDYDLVNQGQFYYNSCNLSPAPGRSGKAASGFLMKTFSEGEQSSLSAGFSYKLTIPAAAPGTLFQFGQSYSDFNFLMSLLADDARATAACPDSTHVNVTVTHGGSYYGTAPKVTIVNHVAGGTYTSATATVSGGAVTGVTVMGASGFDPAHPPTVSIGPGGRGFVASTQMNGITNTTVDTPSSNYIVPNKWYYIELKADVTSVFDLFTGLFYASTDYVLRVNGSTWLSSTPISRENVLANLNDFNFAKAICSTASVGVFDDLYISAGELLPDLYFQNGNNGIRVKTLKPNGVGANTGFTPNIGGAENWQMVKDVIPDDDVTTVKSTQATDGFGSPIQDTYNMEDLPKSVTDVFGIQANVYARKDKAGPGSLDVLRSDNAGGVFVLITDEPSYNISPVKRFRFISKALRNDFGVDWTVEQINDIQIGMRKS